MRLCPPPPHIQCWDCSWGSSCKINHHILPGKSNIDKGEGVIAKVMLPSQHFCPRLSENNCKQFLAYNTKFMADMQLVVSIITVRWIMFIVVVTGHYCQTMEYGIFTYVFFRARVLRDAILRYNSILRANAKIGTEWPFFSKIPCLFYEVHQLNVFKRTFGI